jgi:MFS family permease
MSTPVPPAAPPAPAPLSPFAEPAKLVPGAWIAAFAAAWLGVWMAQLAPFQYLLPLQVEQQLGPQLDPSDPTSWTNSVLSFGIISGIAGACALFTFPLTGAFSDRTTSRFGRRRPWIVSGALVFAAALIALGLQTTIVGIGITWALAITGFSMLSAGLTALISDQVPVRQRGFVSGFLSAPQALGTVLGVLLVTVLITTEMFGDLAKPLGYAALAVLLLALVVPILIKAKEVPLTRAQRPETSFSVIVRGMWVSPRKYPDYAWTLLSRVLINVGNALGVGLLLYFLLHGLNPTLTALEAEDRLLELILVYTVFVVVAAIVLGRVSDRIQRRKIFVILAAVIQAAAAFLLAFVPTLEVTYIGAALLGAGYGAFLSVDQALATQVLPDPHDRGKDLGIMNVASNVPQAVGPLLGAFVVVYLGGFQGLFMLSAAVTALGAVSILLVEKVR